MKDTVVSITRLLTLSCCIAAFGIACGVPLDRDLAYENVPREERTGTASMRIEVKLEKETGEPITGARISAKTPRSEDSDVTNSLGIAVVTAEVGESDGIDFHFSAPHERIEWTRPLFSYPREQSRIRMLFKADSRGQVRLAEVEY